eukprot:5532411-Pyramimonas_sp.AAC.1
MQGSLELELDSPREMKFPARPSSHPNPKLLQFREPFWLSRCSSHMQKRLRLTECGKHSFVTARGIERLLQQVRDEGLPDAFSAATQARKRREIAHQATSHGPLLRRVAAMSIDGKEVDLWFQDPLAFLECACSRSPRYASMITKALDAN